MWLPPTTKNSREKRWTADASKTENPKPLFNDFSADQPHWFLDYFPSSIFILTHPFFLLWPFDKGLPSFFPD
jgi:hypothetical protein